jgi:proliferating cell nuclear antigen
MKLQLDFPILLADPVGIISELVNDVKIKVNSEGLIIGAIDPANVAMVHFKLPKEAFSNFNLEKEQVLGVNLGNLKNILRRCRTGSQLVLEKDLNDNILHIRIQDRIMREFSLALLDLDVEDKELPNLEFSSKIGINSMDFNSAVEDCAIVSDACSFVIKDGKFIIEASGLHSARSEFSSDEVQIQAENCKSKYSLEYLQKFIKGSKLGDKTQLNFASDYPLRLDYKNDKAILSFVLAPRVESD